MTLSHPLCGQTSGKIAHPGAALDIRWPHDVTTVTWSGRVADIIMLMIDSSGRQKVYIVDMKPNVNWEAVDLLERWLDEYNDDCDPDLDEQLRQLQANRLAVKSSADRS